MKTVGYGGTARNQRFLRAKPLKSYEATAVCTLLHSGSQFSNTPVSGVQVRWLFLTAASVICAALWFGFASLMSRLIFGFNEPGLSRVFDAGVALMIAPGLAFIPLAGWVRALLLTK